jgi:uncharacterized phage infection (PIP) family protein YhgE
MGEDGMEENRNDNYETIESSNSRRSFWVAMSALVVVAVAAVTLFYYNYQQALAMGQLTSRESSMSTSISELQSQLDNANAKLNDVSAAQAAAAQAAANVQNGTSRSAARPSVAEANRLKQLQASLDEQKKSLQATQADITQTRSDLQGSLSSTRDELNGSIARTHDELVLLEKRGERDYSEFDAVKSNKFQHTGPLSISLRKTDPKHEHVDLMFLINDRQIGKKSVNLYEPVWVYPDRDAQPVQVVVNRIDKNAVHGYVSAPKYSAADLAPARTPPSDSNSPDNSSSE